MPDIFQFIISSGFSISITILICFFFSKNPFVLMSKINNRSAHNSVVSRGGGIAICLPSIILFLIHLRPYNNPTLTYFCLGATCFFILGFTDDCYNLNASFRLGLTILLSCIICFMGLHDTLRIFDFEISGWPVRIFQITWIVFCVNTFNFMDGIDLMAIMQSILFCIFIGLCLYIDIHSILEYKITDLSFVKHIKIESHLLLCIFCLLLSSCIFSFWNTYPARLFLGDSGSYFFGFVFAYLCFMATELDLSFYNHYHLRITRTYNTGPMILLWFVFGFDVINTLTFRFFSKKNIFEGHRDHIYQLLHRFSWPTYKIVIFYFLLNLGMLSPFFIWIIFRTESTTLIYILWQAFILNWYYYKNRKVFSKNLPKLEELVSKRDALVEIEHFYKLNKNSNSNYFN